MLLEHVVVILTCVVSLCSLLSICVVRLRKRSTTMENNSVKSPTDDNITHDVTVKTRRGSCVHAISNTLSFKRHLSPKAAELPRKLSHRRLFRRSEVGHFLTIRRKSVTSENIKIDELQKFDRRTSCFPHVPRRHSLSSDCTLEHNGEDRANSHISRKKSMCPSSLPPVIEVTEAEVEDHTEPEVSHDASLLHVRRMSRRKSSFCSLERRNARRMSVLRNSPIDIPGIPSKESSSSHTQKRKRHSSSSSIKQTPIQVKAERGLRSSLSEFKGVFGAHAHDILIKRRLEYGTIYQFSALGQKIVFLFDHKDVDALRKAEGRFPRHLDFKHLRLYREKKDYPQGLLISHGEEWKKQRRMLSKMMCSAISVASYLPSIDEVAKMTVSYIEDFTTRDSYDGQFLPDGITGRYAIEAFGRVLYGHSMNCINDNPDNDMITFVEIARQNMEDAKKLLVVPTWLLPLHPAWKRHNEQWNILLKTTMKKVTKYQKTKMFLNHCMLEEVMQNDDMNDGELFINFTDLMLASIDTTSTLIKWCLYELGRNENIQTQVYEEIRSSLARTTDPFGVAQSMTLLKAVIKETLRLHPVGFMTSRITEKDMYIRSVKIPSRRIIDYIQIDLNETSFRLQTHVAMSMYVMGRDPELFPNPEMFEPSRWLVPDKALDKFFNEVPFGFGPRMCIGRRIAEVEVLFFLIHFCMKFRFNLLNEEIGHKVQLLLCPDSPLRMSLNQRRVSHE